MDNLGKIDNLVKFIEEHYQTGAIGHSLYIELITKVRELQVA